MARRRFWRHPNEFKRMAVERFNNCQNIVALAKELGIQRRLLYKWRLGEREHLRVVLWTVVSQRSIATTAVRTNDGIDYWNGTENSPGVSSKSYSDLRTRKHAQGQFWRQHESSKLYGPHWGNARDRRHCACRAASVDFGLTSSNQSCTF